jgi:hypothetical protein
VPLGTVERQIDILAQLLGGDAVLGQSTTPTEAPVCATPRSVTKG